MKAGNENAKRCISKNVKYHLTKRKEFIQAMIRCLLL